MDCFVSRLDVKDFFAPLLEGSAHLWVVDCVGFLVVTREWFSSCDLHMFSARGSILRLNRRQDRVSP